jgi:dihydroorotase
LDAAGTVVMEGGRLVEARPATAGDEVIDATGLWVVPGLIDAHVHLREPGGEHKEDIASGLRAAAKGGFTAVLPMPNTSPPIDTPELTRMQIDKARALGGTRVYPVAAATRGREGGEPGELGALTAAGAVAFSDDGDAIQDRGVMAEVLTRCKALSVPFSEHAEDAALSRDGILHDGPVARHLRVPGWPSAAEYRIVERDIALARELGAHVHFAHMSTKESVALIRKAKAEGLPITAEVTPHHLFLTDETAESAGPLAKVNPPLRPEADRAACRAALADGTLDIVATDHAPHTAEEKSLSFAEAPFGMVGLEIAVGLVLSLVAAGQLTPSRMIEALAASPARIFNLPGGTLAPGAPADVTLIDPSAPTRIDPGGFLSKSQNTPFSGRQVPGRVVRTIVEGKTVYFA